MFLVKALLEPFVNDRLSKATATIFGDNDFTIFHCLNLFLWKVDFLQSVFSLEIRPVLIPATEIANNDLWSNFAKTNKRLLVAYLLLLMIWSLCSHLIRTIPGRGSPLYKLYRFVPPHRVGFLHRFVLKTGKHFAHFGLEWDMVFEGTIWVYKRIYRFNSKWVRKKEKYANSKWIT